MKWMKFTLTTTTDAVDLISTLLYDLGVEGVEIKDHVPLSEDDKKQMFVDLLPDELPDDGTATLHFYVNPETDTGRMSERIREGLDGLSSHVNVGDALLTVEEAEDADWMNNWKQFFKPFRVSDRIVIKPTWEPLSALPDPKPDDLVIDIDPGSAFGTGTHETTKLCILALEQYVKPGMRLLDVGCGSGILSIVGIALGAEYSLGIDIDHHTLPTAYDNRYSNHISPSRFQAISGNLLEDEMLRRRAGFRCFDLAMANILADVILPLSKEVGRHLKPNGYFLASGILDTRADEVRRELEKNGFQIMEESQMGDWISFLSILE